MQTAKNEKLMIFKIIRDIKIVDYYKNLKEINIKLNLVIIRYNVIHQIL